MTAELWTPPTEVVRNGPDNTYRWATVTQVSPLRIRLDGDTAELPLTPDSVAPDHIITVGDRAWVQLFGRRIIVLGYANPQPEVPLIRTTTVSDVINTSSAGFDCTIGVDATRDDKWASIYVNIQKITSALVSTSSGNITNVGMGHVHTAWKPASFAGLVSTGSGQICHGYIDTAGQLVVSAMLPNIDWAVGTTISWHATYPLQSAL